MSDRPFIYIAAVKRSGSGMLSEALTQLPDSVILQEPGLGKGRFHMRLAQRVVARVLSIDFDRIPEKAPVSNRFAQRLLRPLGIGDDCQIRRFKKYILPQLRAKQVMQVGVKEVSHTGWYHYLRHFPDMRFIVSARDPRDIYVSWCLKHGGKPRQSDRMAMRLDEQFKMQMDIVNSQAASFCVTYERLCSEPEAWNEVLLFVDSPLDAPGKVSQLRAKEQIKHGGEITTHSIGRWKKVENDELRKRAQEAFDLLGDYNEFWGYTK